MTEGRERDAVGETDELSDLPLATAKTWRSISHLVPMDAYLAGGTAIAVHLHHRNSADLDFFLRSPVDLQALADELDQSGPLVITSFEPEPDHLTLNAVLAGTKLQFLGASDLVVLEPMSIVAGVRVAGLGDLLAMKLQVLLDRGELRDYFDVLAIERDGDLRVEEGLGLALAKYRPRAAGEFAGSVVRALAYLDDVEEDPGVPMAKEAVAAYWAARVPEITAHLSRYG